jgi:predicted nucleic acid-binding Zn ribbon protein
MWVRLPESTIVAADPYKHCADCGRLKPQREYYPHPGNHDGLASRCIACALANAAQTVGRSQRLRYANAERKRQR